MIALGIALVVTGACLLVAEAHLPSYGALGVAGLVALVSGAVIAVDASGGGLVLVLALALVLAVAAGALLLGAARRTVAVARGRPRTGVEALVGHVGVVRRAPAPLGSVLVDGALWRARRCAEDADDATLREGDPVVVERVNDLTLSVRRAEEWELEA